MQLQIARSNSTKIKKKHNSELKKSALMKHDSVVLDDKSITEHLKDAIEDNEHDDDE